MALFITILGLMCVPPAAGFAGAPAAATVYVAVFDFKTVDEVTGNAASLKGRPCGAQLAHSVRLKLRSQGQGWEVIDRLTTIEHSGPLGCDADTQAVRKLLTETLAVNIGIWGTVKKNGPDIRAKICILDTRNTRKTSMPPQRLILQAGGERAIAKIARQIVEAVTGNALWQPPEYGDQAKPSPKQLGKPLNKNGSFNESGGWERPDNVSVFIEPMQGRGNVLRVKTNLRRDPWLAYRRALLLGRASPDNPPAIAEDSSYGSVAGLEGVHVSSEWIPAKPGQRYWLCVDVLPPANINPEGMFFPKVFIKGFRKAPAEGLPESTLAELKLTAEDFVKLPAKKQKALINEDMLKYPMRYLRECYRWYLSCRAQPKQWNHFAAPFPPRGGLADNVEYLQIQIYSYWPPGEYLWDNVMLYKDPLQNTPLPEEKARTPGGKVRP